MELSGNIIELQGKELVTLHWLTPSLSKWKEVVQYQIEVIRLKASIPQEFEDAIHDYIILGLLVETLENKQRKGENVEQVLDQVMKAHIKVKTYMRKNQIKVHDGEKVNEDFYEFWYTVKVRGGYKEGNNRYWRAAIKRHMMKRLESLRKGESILTREY